MSIVGLLVCFSWPLLHLGCAEGFISSWLIDWLVFGLIARLLDWLIENKWRNDLQMEKRNGWKSKRSNKQTSTTWQDETHVVAANERSSDFFQTRRPRHFGFHTNFWNEKNKNIVKEWKATATYFWYDCMELCLPFHLPLIICRWWEDVTIFHTWPDSKLFPDDLPLDNLQEVKPTEISRRHSAP